MTDIKVLLEALPGGSMLVDCGEKAWNWLIPEGSCSAATPLASEEAVPDVVAYFDQSEGDYRFAWDLGVSKSLHIGYWDSLTWSLRGALARQNEVLAEFGNVWDCSNVFDAGCGVGGSAIFLAKTYDCTVTGMTLSKRQQQLAIKYAAAANVTGAEFLVGDYTNTGLPAGQYDFVWALESTCYASSLTAFASEAYRLLKPGGVLVIADAYLTRRSYGVDERATLDRWLHSWAVKSIPTVDDASKVFRSAGFIETRWADITRYVLPSAYLLYLRALAALPLGRALQLLGRRSEWQQRNLAGAYYQYEVCRQDLARYHMVCTYKPRAHSDQPARRSHRRRSHRRA